jgi:outer membrane receptor for Fe3+-dicitrate
VRYQFRVLDMQAQLRLQVSNLFNRDNWNMDSENSFQPGKPRTWRLVLTLSQ